MRHVGTKILESERLLLRPFDKKDVNETYQNWANDDRVTRYLTWPTHNSIDITHKVIESWLEQYDNLNYYQWAMVYKKNNQVIGSISVVGIDESIEVMEIGYCIGCDYWNRGITTEAFNKVISFLFSLYISFRLGAYKLTGGIQLQYEECNHDR